MFQSIRNNYHYQTITKKYIIEAKVFIPECFFYYYIFKEE
jgi:hypothetical protein